jgi:uncharacterized phiE125 gp8 family phage protein
VVEAVSIEELRQHCRVEGVDETTKLAALGTAARQYYEWRTGRAIHATTLEWTISNWPASDRIRLPRATPLGSIISLKYYDENGTENTWAASNYIADIWEEPGQLVLTYGNSWPAVTLYPVAPIRIRYVGGIPTTSPLTEADEDAKIPILMVAAALWENREAEVIGDLQGIQALQPAAAEWFIQRRIVEYVC